ncbi:hypothetical protein ruthe_02216 [Rubellimicrobium thermophilum DSM 16684]|uniref:PAS fold protein n=1 Tax=Rubellimicrobium thermophilum DSM 16684 TaxID=1123069 RepID=S9QXS1_9RHOB|nr:hypothetical protein [Rubellimicrobium thermophilum]EPX84412.1 hypothetical protein ruthe_02216 [Rubellimicrobium thermophilum DSM 16684]
MGLARRFRAEIDCLRAVLDAMGEAVAVFGPSGALCLANAAYRQLWGGAGDSGPAAGSRDSLAERDIGEEAARWEAACVPSPVWAELREGRAMRSWKAGILLRDGRSVSASTERLPGGMTLARFREEAPPGAPLKASRATRPTLSSGNSPAVLALGEEAACWTPAESRTSRGPRRRPGRRRSARTGQTAPQETV